MGRIADGVRLGGVEITSEGIFEVRDGTRFHFVARANIQRIGVGRGFSSERAVPLLVVGVTSTLAGTYLAVAGMDNGAASSRRDMLSWSMFTVAALLFGLITLFQGMKRGVYLRLEGPGGERRLAIGKTAARREVEDSLRRAESEYRYEVVQGDVDALWPS